MLFFLLSAFFTVSAGKEITITRFVKDDVLLPCNCSNRNLKKDFQWQLEEDKKKGTQAKLIFEYKKSSNVTDNQFETFFDKDSSNCSMLLKNITSDNEGIYRCSFHSGNKYSYEMVTLKVCGSNISQFSQSGGKVYHCNVMLDCNRTTEIKWTLDGRCLTNSTTYKITINNTGDHHFHSTLETDSTNDSEPKCEVNLVCPPDKEPRKSPDPSLKTLCIVISVVLILGLLLIWLTFSQISKRTRCGKQTNINSDKLQNENLLSLLS